MNVFLVQADAILKSNDIYERFTNVFKLCFERINRMHRPNF